MGAPHLTIQIQNKDQPGDDFANEVLSRASTPKPTGMKFLPPFMKKRMLNMQFRGAYEAESGSDRSYGYPARVQSPVRPVSALQRIGQRDRRPDTPPPKPAQLFKRPVPVLNRAFREETPPAACKTPQQGSSQRRKRNRPDTPPPMNVEEIRFIRQLKETPMSEHHRPWIPPPSTRGRIWQVKIERGAEQAQRSWMPQSSGNPSATMTSGTGHQESLSGIGPIPSWAAENVKRCDPRRELSEEDDTLILDTTRDLE